MLYMISRPTWPELEKEQCLKYAKRTDIKYSLDFLRPIRTAEAFEAVDWLHQETCLHCGIA